MHRRFTWDTSRARCQCICSRVVAGCRRCAAITWFAVWLVDRLLCQDLQVFLGARCGLSISVYCESIRGCYFYILRMWAVHQFIVRSCRHRSHLLFNIRLFDFESLCSDCVLVAWHCWLACPVAQYLCHCGCVVLLVCDLIWFIYMYTLMVWSSNLLYIYNHAFLFFFLAPPLDLDFYFEFNVL